MGAGHRHAEAMSKKGPDCDMTKLKRYTRYQIANPYSNDGLKQEVACDFYKCSDIDQLLKLAVDALEEISKNICSDCSFSCPPCTDNCGEYIARKALVAIKQAIGEGE